MYPASVCFWLSSVFRASLVFPGCHPAFPGSHRFPGETISYIPIDDGILNILWSDSLCLLLVIAPCCVLCLPEDLLFRIKVKMMFFSLCVVGFPLLDISELPYPAWSLLCCLSKCPDLDSFALFRLHHISR